MSFQASVPNPFAITGRLETFGDDFPESQFSTVLRAKPVSLQNFGIAPRPTSALLRRSRRTAAGSDMAAYQKVT